MIEYISEPHARVLYIIINLRKNVFLNLNLFLNFSEQSDMFTKYTYNRGAGKFKKPLKNNGMFSALRNMPALEYIHPDSYKPIYKAQYKNNSGARWNIQSI